MPPALNQSICGLGWAAALVDAAGGRVNDVAAARAQSRSENGFGP